MRAESQTPAVAPDTTSSGNQRAESPSESSTPEEGKRTKHTRVHKREKELFGLVTPIFLPLLEARDLAPAKKKEKKRRHKEKEESSDTSPPVSEQGSPPRDAQNGYEHRSHRSKGGEKMEQDAVLQVDTAAESQSPEPRKKSKRPAMKKSSLRKNSGGEKSRRKRVSLVIDDQIFLPADEFQEPPLTSPSETNTSSTSNSTASLDDVIDPRLLPRSRKQTHEEEEYHEHHDPVHHSLPLPANIPGMLPTQHTGHTLPDSPLVQSPIQSSPSPVLHSPAQPNNRTLLEHSPPSARINIPQYASTTPIYASQPERAEEDEEDFNTYVGGPSGSGVDNVDQTGSLGYPSSLGASYMESYMQSRPLSVRMAAVEKAGLDEEEKELLANGRGQDADADVGTRHVERTGHDDDEMDVMGSMEGF
jgi:hypothetical protein